jgi:hypothetical protein
MVVDNEELSVVQSMLTLFTVIDIAWPSRAKLVPSIAEPRKSQGTNYHFSSIFLHSHSTIFLPSDFCIKICLYLLYFCIR